MSLHRSVWFNNVPSREDVGKVLEDYLGATMVNNEWGGDRWTALLVGTKSWSLRRVVDLCNETARICAAARAEEAHEERWIEVFIAEESIDVITRRQDEMVNDIADGFAQLIARYWGGRVEME